MANFHYLHMNFQGQVSMLSGINKTAARGEYLDIIERRYTPAFAQDTKPTKYEILFKS